MKRIKITLASKKVFEEILSLIKTAGISILVNNKRKRIITCNVVTDWLEEELAMRNIPCVITEEIDSGDRFWNIIEFDEYYRSVNALTKEQKHAIAYLTDTDAEKLESKTGCILSRRDHSILKECGVTLAQVGWRNPILVSV